MHEDATQGLRSLELQNPIPHAFHNEYATRGESVSTLAVSADMDSWCDAGATCSRKISDYISETKRNYILAYKGTQYAKFSIALRTNLNGRSPRFETWYDLDARGTVEYSSQSVNCVRDKLFDGNCGKFAVNKGNAFRVGNHGRYTTKLTSFSPLKNSDDYFLTITGKIAPGPAPKETFQMPTVRGSNFNCYGTGNCYFP